MKARHLSIIAKKEFRGLFNERTILLASPAPALHRALLLVPHGRAHLHVRPVLALEIFPLPV